MYKIQTAKYGTNWEDIWWEKPFVTLEKAIEVCKDQETHKEFHFRVITFPENDIKFTVTIPYEGRHINLIDDKYMWLNEIMDDYGIPKKIIHKAILHWLAVHTTHKGL